MALNEMPGQVAHGAATDLAESSSASWWASRTPEELRDIINRGFAGGATFAGAVAEAERRARDETQRLREKAADESVRRKKRVRFLAVGLGLGLVMAIAATIVVWLI